jgi:hypothetical protein
MTIANIFKHHSKEVVKRFLRQISGYFRRINSYEGYSILEW